MKINVLPGETIILFIKVGSTEKPAPTVTTVLTVHRGGIAVPEQLSHIGIASVFCHSLSETEGSFFYEYSDVDRKGYSFNVVKIKRLNGEQIFGPFIEDQEDEIE